MHELLHITIGIIERGMIFGWIVGAIHLSSRIIRFDNLSIEGAFGIGGACCALMVNHGLSSWAALGIAACAGAVSGTITGALATKLNINKLISGIVVTTGLFSITLKIAGANMSINTTKTVLASLPILPELSSLLMLTALACTLIYAIQWFLATELGLLIYTAGHAPQFVTSIGKPVSAYIITALALSNTLAAVSGALFVLHSGYFSIWTNIGTLVIGLAGMILAHAYTTQWGFTLLLGSIAYQTIMTATFEFDLSPEWNKLLSAVLIVILIATQQLLSNQRNRNAYTA